MRYMSLYKNGSAYKLGPVIRFSGSNGYGAGATVSAVIDANGTDQYDFRLMVGNCSGQIAYRVGEKALRAQMIRTGN